MIEIFLAFLRLGLTSFGGPSAHIGYFHAEFVTRRGWLSAAEFAERLALAQFLPGPASSQLGLAIGLHRGGAPGAIAAFLGFTLPSALFMALAGLALIALPQSGAQGGGAAGAIAGLTLVALAVVAQAVVAMARSLCPDTPRRALALAMLAGLTLVSRPEAQFVGLVLAAAFGMGFLRPSAAPARAESPPSVPPGQRRAARHLGLATLVLAVALTIVPAMRPFSQAGALVFGGGHVILPLLYPALAPALGEASFTAGYGLAQALPGPLSSFATYLGAAQMGGWGALGATLAIFAPGFALYLLVLPLWARLAARHWVAGGVAGVNAAVVGLLAATWASQLAPHALSDIRALALSVLLVLLALATRLPPLGLVVLGAGLGALML